ncbi:MAG: M23 family metallopeptidase [Zymomonas mobilis subsp. pomaceae]|uniref:peptidoglycan DD-metalloendopeptidase family protein n=1 Tax=Zymomonas mobilis TaxID=542 RepID=UPI0039E7AB4C
MIKSRSLWTISILCLTSLLFTASLSAAFAFKEARSATHIVKTGETLNGIAYHLGIKRTELIKVNHLKEPYFLQEGQILHLPEVHASYFVKEGDTGLGLAHIYGVSWQRIIALNHLQPPYQLRRGMKLILPVASIENRHEPSKDNALNMKQIVGGAQPAVVHKTRSDKADQVLNFGWPAHGAILSAYGRTDNGRVNNGLDIAATVGSPVFAAEEGRVAYIGTHISILGGVILIQHAQSWMTAYGHLDKIKVAQGDFVHKGQLIAYAGESGQTTRPQLHFEIRHGLKAVNPSRLLPTRQ